MKAFDRDLRSEELLGEAITNEQGIYEITYTAEQFARAEEGTADLIVRVFSREGEELGASEIIFNAPAIATVDLVVIPKEQPQPSEYEQLLMDLSPVLQDIPLADLTEEDIDFLAGDTEIDKQRIELKFISLKKIPHRVIVHPDDLSFWKVGFYFVIAIDIHIRDTDFQFGNTFNGLTC